MHHTGQITAQAKLTDRTITKVKEGRASPSSTMAAKPSTSRPHSAVSVTANQTTAGAAVTANQTTSAASVIANQTTAAESVTANETSFMTTT